MDYLSQNLKYLLLQKGVKRSEWLQTLAGSLECGAERAQAILEGRGSELSENEKRGLTRFSGVDSEKVISQDLLSTNKVDVFSRNVSFLLDRLPHGKKKHLAEHLGVDQTTISRWGNGAQRPTKNKIVAILDYFSLPRTTDLWNDPLFLSTLPIGESETKKWLKDKIEDLDRERLKELAPALMMLLKGKQ